MTGWERRQSKRQWAMNHRDQVRLSNKRWRQTFRTRTNAQAAIRMKRYRKRLRVTTGAGACQT